MNNNKLKEKLKELQNKNIQVYSISRLNTYDECPYSYFLTYRKNNRGIDNIYSTLGSAIHESLEKIFEGKETKDGLIDNLNNTLITEELKGVKFPNDNIKNNWVADMQHYVMNFEKHDKKSITEMYFLFEILPDIWVNGYIDISTENEDGSISCYDYKTSSEFAKKDLDHKAFQLIIYKLALEDLGYTVKDISWDMLKMVRVTVNNKGKVFETTSYRRKWVEKIQGRLNKMLLDEGLDDIEANILIEEAIKNNNIDKFPELIKNNITLSHHILTYEAKEENIKACLKYIEDTVRLIESKSDEECEWNPKEITDKDSFFCQTLCNFRLTCKYLKKFNESKEFPDKKDENPNSIDALFA